MREQRPIAVVGATVVTMTGVSPAPNSVVVIEGGTITKIAPGIDTTHMRVIDGTGRFLTPALADMHAHVWQVTEAAMFLANGVTTVRNMWGAPFHLAWQQRVASGAMPGPRVVTTSPIVDGVGDDGQPVWPGAVALTDPKDADELVEALANRGYQQIKAYSLLSPEAIAALGRAAARVKIPLVGHCPRAVPFEQAIDIGQTCFEHLTNIERAHTRAGAPQPTSFLASREVIAEHLDEHAIRDLAKRMADLQIWNCPTTVVWDSLMIGDFDAARADPLMRYEPETMIASWNPQGDFRFRDEDARALAPTFRRAAARLLDVVSILHQEGAPLMIGTDTPNPFVVQGFSVHDELDAFVRAGMSPLEALRCATAEPARFLGEGGEWGIVAEGARAELLLLDEDPRADVRALRAPAAVFTNGWMLTRAQLDEMLEERARSVASIEGRMTPPEMSASAGQVERAGTLLDEVGGAHAGCCAFRHIASPDGDLEIEELFVPAPGSESPIRRSRVVLASSGAIVRAEVRQETPVGDRVLTVVRADDAYRVRVQAEDGHVEEAVLEATELVPTDRLALSVLPLLLEQPDGAPALDLDGRIATVRRPAGESGAALEIERFGERSVFEIRARDLLLEEMTTMEWSGPRRVVPMDER